jgi:hypothetical protein
MNNREEAYRNDEPFVEFMDVQNRGVVLYGLNEQDVHAPNYGTHTLHAMDFLHLQGRAGNFQEAFKMVRGLDSADSIAISIYERSREDLQTPNFGAHTIMAMDALRFWTEVRTFQEAFEMLRGLDAQQTKGISLYELTREQVLTPNFGSHTLQAMDVLIFREEINNHQQTFQLVSGLNEYQTRGVSDYNLNRTQVMVPEFGESILNVMGALHLRNLSADWLFVYDTVMHLLEEYQIRGIQLQLTLEQVGIAVVDGNFEQDEGVNPRFRANHVDAIEHFMETENMDREEAYRVALKLNSTQINGMISFGLRLDQVQLPFFSNDPEILGKLMEQLFIDVGAEEWDLSIPLDPGQQEKMRNVFDAMITFSQVDHGTENTQVDIQHAEHEMLRMIPEILEVASLPIQNDEQSNEDEKDLTGGFREFIFAQNSSSKRTGFCLGKGIDQSLEEFKPLANGRKKRKS